MATYIAQVPDQAQLIFLESSADEYVASFFGRQVSTLWTQIFEATFQTIRRILQSPVLRSKQQSCPE